MIKNSKFGKYFFISLGSIISLVLIIFLGFLIYYSVQLKYGNLADIEQIVSKYEKSFSSAIDKDAPADVPDFKKLIKNYNPQKGDDSAKVTIIAFMDFECPYCQENYPIFKHISEKYEPVVRIIFKHLPLAEIHANSVLSSLAATCSQEQDKFWPYYDEVYSKQKVDKDSLYTYAQNIGLDTDKFDVCMNSQRY